MKKFITFFVVILTICFIDIAAFEYPGARQEHKLGTQAGALGKADPCGYAGLICSDAYHEAKSERRVEQRIYDAASRR